MEQQPLYALILAGGVGSRLWPRSRGDRPKQMLNLTGERSMLQQTVERIRPLIPPTNIWVMTNAEYVDLVREQLPEVPADQVVGEPAPRGTAPAIGLGAQYVGRRDDHGVMFALHADHHIEDEAGFRRAMEAAAAVARDGWLVSLGVPPTHPETGYGYVEQGEELGRFEGQVARHCVAFHEKPDRATAERYLEQGRYLWNSGIFCWRVDAIQKEFERLIPETQQVLATIGKQIGGTRAQRTLVEQWSRLPEETSIDRAIMERAERVATVGMEVGWNDVGAWDSLARLLPRDDDDNAIAGAGDTLVLDSSNVFVYSEERFVAVVGLQDMIIVDSGDALLIIPPDRAQEVKEIVRRLRALGRDDLL